MPTYKITALRTVTVEAQVWYKGSIPYPKDHQGQSLGRMPKMQNAPQEFVLQTGESKDGIAFLIGAEAAPSASNPLRQIKLPDNVGEKIQDKDLLIIEKISNDAPLL